jgi:small subunit ribosomal protein S6
MTITAEKQVRVYEVTYLLLASFTDSEVSTIQEQIHKLITKSQGKLVSSENWGKKKLAYKIRHKGKYEDQAIYVHEIVELDSQEAPQFEHQLHLNTEIMRYLMVKVDQKKSKPAVKKEVSKPVAKEEESKE